MWENHENPPFVSHFPVDKVLVKESIAFPNRNMIEPCTFQAGKINEQLQRRARSSMIGVG
jgi:hypothetical protein